MDIIVKCSAAGLFGSFVCLLIKKQNPELSLALSTVITACVLLACSGAFVFLRDLLNCTRELLGSTSELIKPMLKCMCIGFISKLGADRCKDAARTALASALEFGGTLCAAASAVPLIISTVKTIGSMV